MAEQKLYNPNEGVFGRDGGPYLDEILQRQGEERRAYAEGREPDYDNLQPVPGVPLQTPGELIANYNPTLISGDEQKTFEGTIEAKPVVVVDVPDEEVSDDTENDEKPADETPETSVDLSGV